MPNHQVAAWGITTMDKGYILSNTQKIHCSLGKLSCCDRSAENIFTSYPVVVVVLMPKYSLAGLWGSVV